MSLTVPVEPGDLVVGLYEDGSDSFETYGVGIYLGEDEAGHHFLWNKNISITPGNTTYASCHVTAHLENPKWFEIISRFKETVG